MVFTRAKKRNTDVEESQSKFVKIDDSDSDNDSEYNPETEKIKTLIREVIDTYDPLQNKKIQNEYTRFKNNLEMINEGDFFERAADNQKYDETELKTFNDELENIKENYKKNAPNVFDILKLDTSIEEKQKLLEKLHIYSNSEMLSNEYNITLKMLLESSNETLSPELRTLETQIKEMTNSLDDSYKYKILTSDMHIYNKAIAYKKLEIMNAYGESESSEYAKYKNWLDTLLSIPFGKTNKLPIKENENTSEYLKNVRTILDKNVSFLEKPKDQVINLITNTIRNPDTKTVNAIGIHGSAGTGKSNLVASLAEALGRPFKSISLGGESDASSLLGHGFTYIGSTAGRIVEILRESDSMNVVIMIDELDKISETSHGKEIIGALIHLTDYTTNHKYNHDRYLSGIEIDLSKVLFVFTYNEPDKIDKILGDRLYKIKVPNYNKKEKLSIVKKHIIPKCLSRFLFTDELTFPDNTLEYIIETSQGEGGMRDIIRRIEIIISRINTLLLTNEDDNIVKLKYKTLYSYYSALPVTIDKSHIDILLNESIDLKEPNQVPFGMYI
jgi:ATP-dependent Lon protease